MWCNSLPHNYLDHIQTEPKSESCHIFPFPNASLNCKSELSVFGLQKQTEFWRKCQQVSFINYISYILYVVEKLQSRIQVNSAHLHSMRCTASQHQLISIVPVTQTEAAIVIFSTGMLLLWSWCADVYKSMNTNCVCHWSVDFVFDWCKLKLPCWVLYFLISFQIGFEFLFSVTVNYS